MQTQTQLKPALHHVTLKTTRLQAMKDWYAATVGMTVTFEFEHGAWLTNDDANHRLALIEAPGVEVDPDKRKHAGLYHMAYEYETLQDLLAAYTRLKEEHGIVPPRTINHGPTTSFYYKDPDDNTLELQADNFELWSESKRFMNQSPRFAADPLGPGVDPEKLIAALDKGLSLEQVLARSYDGQYEPAGGAAPLPFPSWSD
jgi:catechol 2,3-dioxygenase